MISGDPIRPWREGDGSASSTAAITKDIWNRRFGDIQNYEEYLTDNKIIIQKFFLNVSNKEQRKRFLARLDRPEKNWKFSANDIQKRAFWDDDMDADTETIRHTSSPHSPWYVVPADNK